MILNPTNKVAKAVNKLTPVPAKNTQTLSIPMLSINAAPEPIPIEASRSISPICCRVMVEP